MTSETKRLALIGGGGFSKEIAEIARALGHMVEDTYSTAPEVQVGRYRGYLDALLADRTEFDGVVLAVGGVSRRAIRARAELIAWLDRHAFPCPALVSPRAIVSPDVAVGAGAFVAHGVIVNADASLGRFCVLNSAAIVGHDAVVGDNATISPGAFIGGQCKIGANSLVGPLAKVLQGLTLGQGVTVGMGCNVLRTLPDNATIWPRTDIVAPAPKPA
ncbi:acetyltransferase [Methylobacterium sp. E-065]|uniref:acetyltransferase n=1 Tax=Methylobacterium sp. E-065 TaxID=2836583 RepID=UPI001FBBAEB7|nr:acetyltransferase [Methylobacterium sp. E-065]MCJ2016184.1 acetyltransferase [Methylobacterium sp. E-065]